MSPRRRNPRTHSVEQVLTPRTPFDGLPGLLLLPRPHEDMPEVVRGHGGLGRRDAPLVEPPGRVEMPRTTAAVDGAAVQRVACRGEETEGGEGRRRPKVLDAPAEQADSLTLMPLRAEGVPGRRVAVVGVVVVVLFVVVVVGSWRT
jgi:hypothetical protein